MGFEYLSSGGLLESGASAAGIYFLLKYSVSELKLPKKSYLN